MRNWTFFLLIINLSCNKEFSINDGLTQQAPTTIVLQPTFDSSSYDIFANNSLFLQNEPFEGEILKKQTSNPKFTKRVYQGIPSIGIDRNSLLYTCWYSGGNDEGPGNYITLSISTDKGKTWKQNELIINPTIANVRFFDPCFLNDKYNNLYLTFTKSKSTTRWDGRGGVWASKLISRGDSLTITIPKRISDGVLMNKPIVTMDKASIVFPISKWYVNDSSTQKAFIYSGNFGTLFFDQFRQVGNLPINPLIRTVDEHQIVQTDNNSFLAMIRTTDGIYYSTSKTGLNGWENCKKFTAVGNTTPSRFYLGKTKSNKLVLILNNSLNRENLKIFLSNDSGITWKYSILLDARLGVSYPDLVEGENNELFICYDYDRYGVGEINILSLKESDIITGNSLNIIKKTISANR